jgi:hypothetical protein
MPGPLGEIRPGECLLPLFLFYHFNRLFKNLILAVLYSFYRWFYYNIGNNSYSLCPFAIRIENTDAADHCTDSATR